jgi:hypothetical protein
MKGDASTLNEDARLLREEKRPDVRRKSAFGSSLNARRIQPGRERARLGVSFRISRMSRTPQYKTKVPEMNRYRRSFMIGSIGMGASLWLARASADTPHLSTADPAAKAVGYTENAAKVDKTKYPSFAAGQTCANCSLYQGKSSDAWGGCTLFADKLVAGPGWCSSYTNM